MTTNKILTAVTNPMPKVLFDKGLTDSEWEVMINAPIDLLKGLIRAVYSQQHPVNDLLYPIDKGVPPPKFYPFNPPKSEAIRYHIPPADFRPPFHINDRHPPWPFDYMHVGDSFVAPRKLQTALGNYRAAAQRKGREVTFVSRTINADWIRIWCLHQSYGPDHNGLLPKAGTEDLEDLIQQTAKAKADRIQQALNAQTPALQPIARPVDVLAEYNEDVLSDPKLQSPEVREALLRMAEVRKMRAGGITSKDALTAASEPSKSK